MTYILSDLLQASGVHHSTCIHCCLVSNTDEKDVKRRFVELAEMFINQLERSIQLSGMILAL